VESQLTPRDLVALNRLTTIARLLVGTVHDLNNALQIISGSAELIAGRSDVSELPQRAVQRIQTQSARASSALNEVLTFARARSTENTPVSLSAITASAAALCAFQVRRAGVQLLFDTASAPRALVQGRANELQQAIINLILNAVQAVGGEKGGTIRLDLVETGGHVTLTVTDNGHGIAPDIVNDVFEPFFTRHGAEDATGLGLTAARIIAQTHGGDIAIDTPGSGCRVLLRLPAATPLAPTRV
jgi:signal transduction histidine kinase